MVFFFLGGAIHGLYIDRKISIISEILKYLDEEITTNALNLLCSLN
jgi:hypothetical protein